MKLLILALLSSLISLSAHAGFSTIAVCATGDAVAGVEIGLIDRGDLLRIAVQSMANDQEDQVFLAEVNSQEVKSLKAGKSIVVTGRSDDSTDFGGAVSHAVLFQIQLRPGIDQRASRLAIGSSVISLACRPGNWN